MKDSDDWYTEQAIIALGIVMEHDPNGCSHCRDIRDQLSHMSSTGEYKLPFTFKRRFNKT